MSSSCRPPTTFPAGPSGANGPPWCSPLRQASGRTRELGVVGIARGGPLAGGEARRGRCGASRLILLANCDSHHCLQLGNQVGAAVLGRLGWWEGAGGLRSSVALARCTDTDGWIDR